MQSTVWEDHQVVADGSWVEGTAEDGPALPDPVAGSTTEVVPAPDEIAAAMAAADSKGALDTVAFDVRAVSGITSYFVVCSATSGRQVKAIAEEVERRLGEEFAIRPVTIEGMDSLEWVLVNYGYFLVHVFLDSVREFYDLERLWRDAPRLAT